MPCVTATCWCEEQSPPSHLRNNRSVAGCWLLVAGVEGGAGGLDRLHGDPEVQGLLPSEVGKVVLVFKFHYSRLTIFVSGTA